MRRARFGGIFVVLLALAAPSARALPPWSIHLLYGKDEIFPSILASVTESSRFPPRYPVRRQLGDPTGLVAAEIRAPTDNFTVRVTVGATAIFGRSSIKATLPRAGEVYRVAPFLDLNHDAILRLRHPIPCELLDVTVESEGEQQTKTLTVRIWSITDCVMYLRTPAWLRESGSDGGPVHDWLDTRYLAAAFVNENNEEAVPRVISHALKRGHINRFSGYETGRTDEVRAQVQAIYDAMHDLGFKYSLLFVTTSAMANSDAATQSIRLAGDAVGARQANCIDGSALMAGILTRLGINSSIYVTPSHAFLVVDLDPAGRQRMGVETTLVSDASFKRAESEGETARQEAEKSGRLTSFIGLTAESLEKSKSGRVFRIAVSATRANGIIGLAEPLPQTRP